MTRKQNISFVKIGLAALVGVFLVAILNAVLFYFGLATSKIQLIFEALFPLLAIVSFICLGWFGVMPRVGTRMFLARMFDNPQAEHMFKVGLYRFIFLITDDRRVLDKLAAKGVTGGTA
ncbi:hypothetical protein [Mesorhizobium sp. CN2-181]|uniref:hypothetical protein n=1 Tax=Mesorhizobium yinganensis TaxID=3157707 RepID=UPI0032B7C79C